MTKEIEAVVEGELMLPYVEYHSNNSGGYWWLNDSDWRALESAGWVIGWLDKSWLGANACEARKYGATLEEAIEQFDSVTSQWSTSLGCSCCGAPHSFTLYDAEGRYVRSWSPDYPSHGESYY